MDGGSLRPPALISPDLLDLLVCPTCRGGLVSDSVRRTLGCTACGARYPVHLEIPILLPPALQQAERHADRSGHKHQQVAFFDQDPRDDFGITRPRGAPELHAWLLREKFRRSILGLEGLLPTSTALTICGGSGIDAEFLAEKGARVILSDISLGVVLQARERARRFGLDFELVVADAEALPFRNSSVDIVYVHDGLHHLEQPSVGLAEMARVARRAVSITEPAAARATAAAIRLGWAESQEEAGNPVRRLSLDEIVSDLTVRGFRPIRPHRYAMSYRHWPGRPMTILSTGFLLPLAKAGFALLNRAFGRYGNKLAVQAIRDAEPIHRR
jgi:uncharacterized protein YbaR (Trm112 family)/SAM-dependent methyltransferase